jgi:hypothetical protein
LRTRLATPCLPLATSKHACLPAASSQTRIDVLSLYKIHTLEWQIDRVDHKPYKALTS